jgi:ribosome recycling factor
MAQVEDHMKRACDALEHELQGIRAGRASASVIEHIQVSYYGVPTPVTQVASVSIPEPRQLIIQPWEKSLLKDIEKAILTSDLGITPSNDGTVIRLVFPQLTEERRKELVKMISKHGEEARVNVRNVRRDANEDLKKSQKAGDITEDEERKGETDVQKATDKYIKEIDNILARKEKEILSV